MANVIPFSALGEKYLTLNNTLTSGITKVDASKKIAEIVGHYGDGYGTNMTRIQVNGLVKAVTNANLGFGEHIASFPLGKIQPLGAEVAFTTHTTTGCANGGEVGLGTTIASGAVATLGGTVAFGNLMDGTTVAALTAATTEEFFRGNLPDLTGTKATNGVMVLDSSATAAKIHLNWAGDHDASENFTFSAIVDLWWRYMGRGA